MLFFIFPSGFLFCGIIEAIAILQYWISCDKTKVDFKIVNKDFNKDDKIKSKKISDEKNVKKTLKEVILKI